MTLSKIRDKLYVLQKDESISSESKMMIGFMLSLIHDQIHKDQIFRASIVEVNKAINLIKSVDKRLDDLEKDSGRISDLVGTIQRIDNTLTNVCVIAKNLQREGGE